jgi:hypothetical protein
VAKGRRYIEPIATQRRKSFPLATPQSYASQQLVEDDQHVSAKRHDKPGFLQKVAYRHELEVFKCFQWFSMVFTTTVVRSFLPMLVNGFRPESPGGHCGRATVGAMAPMAKKNSPPQTRYEAEKLRVGSHSICIIYIYIILLYIYIEIEIY